MFQESRKAKYGNDLATKIYFRVYNVMNCICEDKNVIKGDTLSYVRNCIFHFLYSLTSICISMDTSVQCLNWDPMQMA